MARRLHQTMADYVVIALSPALIMTLVGSLVFFLLQVLYQGQFVARLHWVLACFVFGAVLIGRISIEEGFERAAPFGMALATVVGLAIAKFVDVQGSWIGSFGMLINWSLIALIWWCAHRLTWDCTLVDDSQDSSGEGLLQTAGLERPATVPDQPAASADSQRPKRPRNPKDSQDSPGDAFDPSIEGTTWRRSPASDKITQGWWQRYVERQRRPHAPGVWVVYFSLAALPIFGVGQWFIPAGNLVGRRYAFWLLCVYVASGLGLLLTTSFLGLRRYLRQRRIEMPTAMANLWLGVGAAIIVALLLFAALLPRPSAEYAISELPFSVGSPDQHASREAPVSSEGTKGQQAGSAAENPAPQNSTPQDRDNSSEPASPSNSPASGSAENSPGSPPNEQPPPASAPGQPNSQTSETRSTQSGSEKSVSGKGSNPSQASGPGKASGQGKGAGQAKGSGQSQGGQSPQNAAKSSQSGERPEVARQQQADKNSTSGPQKPLPEQTRPNERQNDAQDKTESTPRESRPEAEAPQEPPDAAHNLQIPQTVSLATGTLAELLKWAFYALIVLTAAYFLWRFRVEVLAAIREFLAALRDFWNGMWGIKRTGPARKDVEVSRLELPPVPFSTYTDPFASGIASQYSLEELVRYSFEAFEAWSREHGCPRAPDQTPHELARRVGRANAQIAPDARNLAELYARAAYANTELSPSASHQLQHLWQQMRATTANSL